MRRTIMLAALLAPGFATAACRDAAGTVAGPPVSAAVASGDGQRGSPETRLALPLRVKVTDTRGRGVRGVHVAWTVDPLGGSLDAGPALTDGRGISTAGWVAGTYAGEWTATARVAGLPPVVFHATVVGPVTLVLLQPLPGDTVDSLNLVVAARGAAAFTEVSARVGDTTVALRPDGQVPEGLRFVASLPLEGALSEDHAVVVTAGDAGGNAASVRTDVHHDPPPELGLPEPLQADSGALLAGPTHVRALCRDDDGGCRDLRVSVNGLAVAAGRDSAAATFSVAGFPADSLRFVVTATGAHGVPRTITSAAYRVEASPAWSTVQRVRGRLVDGDDAHVLYADSAGLHLLDLPSGNDTTFVAGAFEGVAFVTATGAVAEHPKYANGHEIVVMNDGHAQSLIGERLAAGDEWVAWVATGPQVVRTRLRSGGQARSPVPVYVWQIRVADDGTLAFGAEIYVEGGGSMQLIVMRPDGRTEQLTHDTVDVPDGWAEGSLAVYLRHASRRYAECCVLHLEQVVLAAPDGEHALTALTDTSRFGAFQLRDGWVLLRTGAAPQFWMRSPTGEMLRVGAGLGGLSAWYSLGPGGRLVLSAGGRLYLLAPPFGAPRDIGADHGGVRWHQGRLYALVRNGVFRIDP